MKILVAVDGSEAALHAVEFAVDLLRRTESMHGSITLISVHDDAALNHAKSIVGKEPVKDYLREMSANDLEAARALLDSSGVKHHVEVRTGHVASQIVDFAHAGKFDLVAVGAKGRHAIADLLLGSVARRVLAMASMPVVLVK